MRGFDEFYGMLGGFNTYWQETPFQTRLPAGRPKRSYKAGSFYSTNAFGDYALDFLEEGHKSGKPWFLYLAFNAPHFPLHAPEEAIQKYETLYLTKGWDAIRADRLARQKQLGLAPAALALPPRDVVPSNFINRQTGWADREIPAWNTLPADRRADLARRMAVYAAAVDIMDRNIGRITDHLKKTGEWDNTLIFFLSDYGACAEWDPYGFDQLDSPKNIIHAGEDLKRVGGPDSYISYGSGWANASNTPLRLFKHYAEEGGIRTPMIVHWPQGLKTKPGTLTTQTGYVTDFMPTLVEICGARYPADRNGVPIPPSEGFNLAATLRGGAPKPRTLCVEHEGNRMVREGNWKLVALSGKPWELYDLAGDPTEMRDLAQAQPDRVHTLEAAWNAWAERSDVITKPSPRIANRPLVIRCEVMPARDNSSGVLLAQGGDQQGYALSLKEGRPVFSVRIDGRLYEIAASAAQQGRFSLEAHLARGGAMTLLINGKKAASGAAPGLITAQPKDGLSIGEDTLSAVGDYRAPNRFPGKVENVKVDTLESSD
jgi:arylsulfatase